MLPYFSSLIAVSSCVKCAANQLLCAVAFMPSQVHKHTNTHTHKVHFNWTTVAGQLICVFDQLEIIQSIRVSKLKNETFNHLSNVSLYVTIFTFVYVQQEQLQVNMASERISN